MDEALGQLHADLCSSLFSGVYPETFDKIGTIHTSLFSGPCVMLLSVAP